MKKLTQRERPRVRGLAQVLIAQGEMTDREIAKYLQIPVFALTRWRVEPYFKGMVNLLKTQLEAQRARTCGLPIISDQNQGGEPPQKS